MTRVKEESIVAVDQSTPALLKSEKKNALKLNDEEEVTVARNTLEVKATTVEKKEKIENTVIEEIKVEVTAKNVHQNEAKKTILANVIVTVVMIEIETETATITIDEKENIEKMTILLKHPPIDDLFHTSSIKNDHLII